MKESKPKTTKKTSSISKSKKKKSPGKKGEE